MNCIHFGKCGACDLYQLTYIDALSLKEKRLKELLEPFYKDKIEIFSSPKSNHRARGEFRVWHKDKKAFYALTNLTKDGIEIIKECSKLLEPIQRVWTPLLEEINKDELLKEKLFSIEFLSGLSGEVLITLIYHKRLDDSWKEAAKELEESLGSFIIGRAKKQKEIISRDYIKEKIEIDKEYFYRYFEGGFTQPNPYINQKMIKWAKDIVKEIKERDDFLELYCGLGNFTIPLSFEFKKVLATEVSKTSIKNAKINKELNGAFNIEFVRLNAAETYEALNRKREFNRLRSVNLDEFNFSTILVDPPRAGLDSSSLELVKQIDNIIYISCNPLSLKEDLKELTKTHKIKRVAMFDQFPYTHHIESGVYLERI